MEKEKSKMKAGKKRTLVNTSVLMFIGVGVLLFLVNSRLVFFLALGDNIPFCVNTL